MYCKFIVRSDFLGDNLSLTYALIYISSAGFLKCNKDNIQVDGIDNEKVL
jgi:hypothetical protein